MKFMRTLPCLAVLGFLLSCQQPVTREQAESDVVLTPGAGALTPAWSGEATAFPYKKVYLSSSQMDPGVDWKGIELEGVPPYPSSSGQVYVVHGDRLMCLDRGDGSEKGGVRVYGVHLQVAEWQGRVAVYEHSGRLRFFMAGDGSPITNEITTQPDGVLASLDDIVFLYGKAFLHAYDMHSGNLLWNKRFVPGAEIAPLFVSLHTGEGAAVLELYSKDRGYSELQRIDPRTGRMPVWRSLGRVLAIDSKRIYIHKKQEQEVWARDAATGDLVMLEKRLLIHKLEQYSHLFFHPMGDDAIYASDQRFFDPEAAEISAEKVSMKPSTPFTMTEIVRQTSTEPRKMTWHIGVDRGPTAVRWMVQDGILLEISGETEPHGDVFHTLKAYRLTDAALLWRVDSGVGLTHVAMRDHRLYFTTLDGWLHAYQYE